MNPISFDYCLVIALLLFCVGLSGVLLRRDIIFILMSIEVMLNAAGLAFIIASSKWSQPDGQVAYLFILVMAAAEVSIGLALVMQLYHRFKSLDVDLVSELSG